MNLKLVIQQVRMIIIFEKQNFLMTSIGLAIRKEEMRAWKQSPNCVPPPDNCMYCPLCLASVEDTDDTWRQHMLYGCPKNSRSYNTS